MCQLARLQGCLGYRLVCTERKPENGGVFLSHFAPTTEVSPFLHGGVWGLWLLCSPRFTQMLAVPRSLQSLVSDLLMRLRAKLFIFWWLCERWLSLGMLWGCRCDPPTFLLARDGSEQTPLPQSSFSTSLGSWGSISYVLQGRFGLQNASSDREEQPELPLGLFFQLLGLRPALQKMGSDRGLSVLGKLPARFCSCL